MIRRLLEKIDYIYYQKILRPLLSLSKLGRASILGRADSGLNFDHMYRNKPKGITPLGKFIDRVLLNLPSVKATRSRKDIIIKILQNEITNNIFLGEKTRIVDIASGPARYLAEVVNKINQDKIEILCIDRDRKALNFGKILGAKKPIRYTKANILKIGKLKNFSKKVSWRPNIILSSGLLEYLSDKEARNILCDIYQMLEIEGLLIFVTQKDNPSKELMRKICRTQDGRSWELVYRDASIIRRWLLDIGFKYTVISADQWGMYEFCTTRKMK